MQKSFHFRELIWLVLINVIQFSVSAADWPQYRGPNHDGSTPEKISLKWPTEGPRQVWKANLGDSFGSFAVAGGKAYGRQVTIGVGLLIAGLWGGSLWISWAGAFR